MKHTNFYIKLDEIRNQEIQELKIAIQAHNGVVEWNNNGPVISLSGTNMIEHPFDVSVVKVSLSSNGTLQVWGHNYEDWRESDGNYEIDVYNITTGQVAYIIDEIPETESVSDVSVLQEYFEITSICRDDLKERGFDISNVSDATMKKLASAMCDDYCEHLFWDSMRVIAETYLHIPKDVTEDDLDDWFCNLDDSTIEKIVGIKKADYGMLPDDFYEDALNKYWCHMTYPDKLAEYTKYEDSL